MARRHPRFPGTIPVPTLVLICLAVLTFLAPCGREQTSPAVATTVPATPTAQLLRLRRPSRPLRRNRQRPRLLLTSPTGANAYAHRGSASDGHARPYCCSDSGVRPHRCAESHPFPNFDTGAGVDCSTRKHADSRSNGHTYSLTHTHAYRSFP